MSKEKSKQKTAKKGNGHIRLREDGRWEGQYYFEGKRKSIYGTDYEAVRTELNDIITAILKQAYIDGSTMPLFVYLERWLDSHTRIRPRTRTNYRSYINNHFKLSKLGSVPLKRLESTELQAFMDKKETSGRFDGKEGGLSSKSIHNIYTMLNEALDKAVRPLKYLSSNPLRGVVKPTVIKPEMRFLEDHEQARIEEVILNYPDVNALTILFDLYCGLRIGELLAIKKKDWSADLSKFKVHSQIQRLYIDDVAARADKESYVPLDIPHAKPVSELKTMLYLGPVKTMKGKRTIFTNEVLRFAVKQIWNTYEKEGISNDQGFAFLDRNGYPYDPRTYVDLFKKVMAEANIPDANFHALRHTFAVNFAEQTNDYVTLKEIMGHTDTSTTFLYCHAREKQKKKGMDMIGSRLSGLIAQKMFCECCESSEK